MFAIASLVGTIALASCSVGGGASSNRLIPVSAKNARTMAGGRVETFTLFFSAQLAIGTPSSVTVSSVAYDAEGNVISGSYTPTIAVVDNDRSGQTTLSGKTIASSTQTLTMSYKGRGDTFAVTGSVGQTHHVYALRTVLPPETPLASPTPGNSSLPAQIRLGSDGNLWSVVSGQNLPGQITVARISPAGAVTLFSDPNATHWYSGWSEEVIAKGSDGAMWFPWGVGSNVGLDRVDTSGTITSYTLPTTIGDAVASIAAGPGAAIWFTTTNSYGPNYDVVALSSDGTFHTIASGLPYVPYNLVQGPDGNMWFTDGTQVDRLTPSGALSSFSLAGVTTGNPPLYFALGPDGNFWAPYPFGDNELVKFNTSGAVVSIKKYTTLPVPRVYDINSDSNAVWLADYNYGVVRIARDGSSSEFPTYTAGSLPNSVAVGSDGRVYFVDTLTLQSGTVGGMGSVDENMW